jgi:hypothetical protein
VTRVTEGSFELRPFVDVVTNSFFALLECCVTWVSSWLPIFWCRLERSSSRRKMFFGCTTLENGHDMCYRNVGSHLPACVARHPGKTMASIILQRMSEISHCYEVWDQIDVFFGGGGGKWATEGLCFVERVGFSWSRSEQQKRGNIWTVAQL